MPQLILHPWFYILVTSWFILLFLAPKKIMTHTDPNIPDSKQKVSHHKTWAWPW